MSAFQTVSRWMLDGQRNKHGYDLIKQTIVNVSGRL